MRRLLVLVTILLSGCSRGPVRAGHHREPARPNVAGAPDWPARGVARRIARAQALARRPMGCFQRPQVPGHPPGERGGRRGLFADRRAGRGLAARLVARREPHRLRDPRGRRHVLLAGRGARRRRPAHRLPLRSGRAVSLPAVAPIRRAAVRRRQQAARRRGDTASHGGAARAPRVAAHVPGGRLLFAGDRALRGRRRWLGRRGALRRQAVLRLRRLAGRGDRAGARAAIGWASVLWAPIGRADTRCF